MSPENVVKILKSHGVVVSAEEAKFIIDFLKKFAELANKVEELNILQKPILNFAETCTYLHISPSHLYKLTSQKLIPHFCPQGKKLYFRRDEIDQWLQRNRQCTMEEIDQLASNYVIRNKRGR